MEWPQKGAKGTKEEDFFVFSVFFCGKCVWRLFFAALH
jgi:hypothetical protein